MKRLFIILVIIGCIPVVPVHAQEEGDELKKEIRKHLQMVNEDFKALEAELDSLNETYLQQLRNDLDSLAGRLKNLNMKSRGTDIDKGRLSGDSAGLSHQNGRQSGDSAVLYGKDTNEDENDRFQVHIGDGELNIRLGDSRKEKKLRNVEAGFLLLELGVNTYLYDASFDLPTEHSLLEPRLGKSINVQLYPFKLGFNLVDHKLNLFTGLGIDYNNYRFRKSIRLTPFEDSLKYTLVDEGYKKYKIVGQYLFVPLELNYESNAGDHDRSFRFTLGGRAGFLIRSYSKMVDNNGDKNKIFDNYNLNNFRYGVSTSIGYGMFNLYANYYLSDLFKDGIEPELTPIAFGVVLNGFEWN